MQSAVLYCATCHSSLPFLSSSSFAHFLPHFPIAPLSLFAILNRFCTYALFLLSPLPILGSPQSLWFCSPPSHSFHHGKRLSLSSLISLCFSLTFFTFFFFAFRDSSIFFFTLTSHTHFLALFTHNLFHLSSTSSHSPHFDFLYFPRSLARSQ